ncbi:MAG TPA: SRPBCC family protein [Polyangiaceae bacterium]|nr:SRPBCC family protein [Polyangiaceae bacterium]
MPTPRRGAIAACITLARALGWFSIGLGLTELLLPRRLGRVIGVGEHPVLLPLLGLREIGSGVAILLADDPAVPVRSRVVGDAMDLALLGCAFVAKDGERGKIAAATAAVAGVTVVDVLCSKRLAANGRGATWRSGAIELSKSIAINRPVDELYGFWRQLENLPQVMSHVRSVRADGGQRSHWVANLPGNKTLEWDAEITNEIPNELLAWRSLEGSPLGHEGFVHFRALSEGRGTMITVKLKLEAPRKGALRAITKLLGEVPELQIGNDLRRFKQLMETGEVATTEGQPSGHRSIVSRHLP